MALRRGVNERRKQPGVKVMYYLSGDNGGEGNKKKLSA